MLHLVRTALAVQKLTRPAFQGYGVVKKLEAVGSSSGTTSKEAVIADCGVLAA